MSIRPRAKRRHRSSGLLVLLAAPALVSIGLLAPVTSGVSAAAPTLDLGTLGGNFARAAAVSNGIIVGHSDMPGDLTEHAFAYDLNATPRAMRDLGTLGGPDSQAVAVSGEIVVGTSDTADGDEHAFAYDLSAASGSMVDLGTLGGSFSKALDVSGTVIVGFSGTGDNTSRAFAYDLGESSPSMLDLGTLGGSHSVAGAVDGDIVVGSAAVAGDAGDHAFAYDLNAASPSMIDLGTLGGANSGAQDVSGDIVVGESSKTGRLGFHVIHAFAYDLGAGSPEMEDLGDLGSDQSHVAGVSGGVVVGWSQTAPPALEQHARAYDLAAPSAGMQDLGTLGGSLSEATDVSGNVVVGRSNHANDSSDRAFVYDLAATPQSMRDLGALGSGQSIATAIDQNIVVGFSGTADNQTHATAWDITPPEFGLVAAKGPGDLPHVRAFTHPATPTGQDFLAYGQFAGGVFVASGRINADSIPDIVTGAGSGGGPHVKVFDGATGNVIRSFFAYASAFRGGVTVAAGDVNGDGQAEIVTGAGPGGGPHVIVFDGATGNVIRSFFAYASAFRGGVFVAAGDAVPLGYADIVTGAGSSGGPHVKIFDGNTASLSSSFFAFASSFRGGVRVAAIP